MAFLAAVTRRLRQRAIEQIQEVASNRASLLRKNHTIQGSYQEAGEQQMEIANQEWLTYAISAYPTADRSALRPEDLSDRIKDLYFAYVNAFLETYQKAPGGLKYQDVNRSIYQ